MSTGAGLALGSISSGAAVLVALRLPCTDQGYLVPQRASETSVALLSSLLRGAKALGSRCVPSCSQDVVSALPDHCTHRSHLSRRGQHWRPFQNGGKPDAGFEEELLLFVSARPYSIYQASRLPPFWNGLLLMALRISPWLLMFLILSDGLSVDEDESAHEERKHSDTGHAYGEGVLVRPMGPMATSFIRVRSWRRRTSHQGKKSLSVIFHLASGSLF